MLLSFSLRNYRSFHNRHSLRLVKSDPNSDVTNPIEAPMAGVEDFATAAKAFGANGTLQENFFDGLATMRQLVLFSAFLTDGQFSELYTPSKRGMSELKAIDFEIELEFREMRYRYSVSYDAVRVKAESLFVFVRGEAQRWFSRKYDVVARKYNWNDFSSHFKGDRSAWQLATNSHALFLTVAAHLNSKQLYPLLGWFVRCLDLRFDECPLDLGFVESKLSDAVAKKPILATLKGAGLLTRDVQIYCSQQNESRLQQSPHSLLKQKRANVAWPGVPEGITREPGATHRLLFLAARIVNALQKERLQVVNQLGADLTPLIAGYFLQVFTLKNILGQHPGRSNQYRHISLGVGAPVSAGNAWLGDMSMDAYSNHYAESACVREKEKAARRYLLATTAVVAENDSPRG